MQRKFFGITVQPEQVHIADLVILERFAVEHRGKLEAALPAQNQVLRLGGYAKLFFQLPQGGIHKALPGRDMSRTGNIVTAGERIFLVTALLQQNFQHAVFAAYQPHMAGTVAQPKAVRLAARHSPADGVALLVDQIQHFFHGISSLSLNILCSNLEL